MDWKRLSWVDWFLGVVAAGGLFVYGIACIVTHQGVLIVPFHSMGQGSAGDGLTVYGTAAVRTGWAYLVWAVCCHVGGLWKAHRQLDKGTWGKIVMALFAAGVAALLWAMSAV